jgi:sigma-B regulation protein RsbU (phosphoserine phosphatase)
MLTNRRLLTSGQVATVDASISQDAGIESDIRETRRQRAVESLGLTEPTRNPQLDRVARIAQATFGVEFSSITVFDHDRALFVGRGGFEATESPRADSPCRLVVETGRIVTTDDARTDSRFDNIANIRGLDLGFYAGHPLRDSSGNIVGSLCLLDLEPRTLSISDLAVFADLAHWAQAELLADAEAVLARATQQALLPAAPLKRGGIQVSGVCVPANSVGGDYFDYGPVGSLVHVAMGDVMGKGTAAAIIGAATRAAARAVVPTVERGEDLGHGVERIEAAMINDLQHTNTFVTYFHAMVDLDTAILYWVDAGAGLSLLVHEDGTSEQLTGSGLPLGIEQQDHVTHSVALHSGDRLVMVSDGLLDIVEDQRDWIPEVRDLVNASTDGADAVRRIAAVSRDRVPIDDVTVVVMEYRP